MQKTSASRTGILVILLLIACYAADSAEDYYSYNVAARWRAFAYANGEPKTISGGSFDERYAILAASGMGSAVSSKETKASSGFMGASNTSAISAVFGNAMGEPAANPDSDDANSFGRRMMGQSGQSQGLGRMRVGGGTGLSDATSMGGGGSSFGMSSVSDH